MKSAELQKLTASEPLTLEQEYKMQQSWLMDDDSKFSFSNFNTLTGVFLKLSVKVNEPIES